MGNLAPDAKNDRERKDAVHFNNIHDGENALREFARKANNDYLKGMLLHLFVDRKWWKNIFSNLQKKEGENWYKRYNEGNLKMTSNAFHNTEWADVLLFRVDN